MVKIVKNPGNGRLNNLNDPDRPQCVKTVFCVLPQIEKDSRRSGAAL